MAPILSQHSSKEGVGIQIGPHSAYVCDPNIGEPAISNGQGMTHE